MTASPRRSHEQGRGGRSGRGNGRVDGVMPFHPLFLALVLPPLAAIGTLFAFGADAPLGPALLAALPPAYLFGAVPALLGGVLDRHLARRRVAKVLRLAVAAALAATAGLVLLAPALLTGRIRARSSCCSLPASPRQRLWLWASPWSQERCRPGIRAVDRARLPAVSNLMVADDGSDTFIPGPAS